MIRVERAVKERLSLAESEGLMPQDMINAKPVAAAIKEFFGSSQLSQFMGPEQSAVRGDAQAPGPPHSDRAASPGNGPVSRSGDVHPTHYGRVCPIETPEGPNIGLINSLATYSQTNEYGFLETPYRRVENGKVTDKIDYLSAIDEAEYVIAQASAPLTDKNEFVEELVDVRHQNEFTKDGRGERGLHGCLAQAGGIRGRISDSVPRARRRQPGRSWARTCSVRQFRRCVRRRRSSAPAWSVTWPGIRGSV